MQKRKIWCRGLGGGGLGGEWYAMTFKSETRIPTKKKKKKKGERSFAWGWGCFSIVPGPFPVLVGVSAKTPTPDTNKLFIIKTFKELKHKTRCKNTRDEHIRSPSFLNGLQYICRARWEF
jgi:hypothetical protein